jgi:hypothetical protein
MRLFIEGHAHRRGYAIARAWSNAECRALPAATEKEAKPVRYVVNHKRARALVERWNRRFASQQKESESGS